MKRLFTLLLLTFQTFSWAQDNAQYKEIRKGSGDNETVWHAYFDEHGLLFTEKCVSGIEKGHVIDYYPFTGYKRIEGNYNDQGKMIGLWTFYSEAGKEQIRKTINYNDKGEKHGESITYDSVNQTITAKGDFLNGKRVGEWLFFNSETGTLTSKEKICNSGQLCDFEQTTYHSNGKLSAKGIFVDGKKSGEWNYYYFTGELKAKILFANGQREGISFFYDSVHHLKQAEEEYKAGLLNGLVRNYYLASDKVESVAEYKNGKKEGRELRYDSLTSYILRENFNVNGKETGVSKRYYPGSQKLMLTVQYENGKANGIYSKYDSTTGTLIRKGMCNDGEWVGEWISYYTGTEQIRSISDYTAHSDKYTVSYYDKTGKKISSGKFDGYKREGKWTYYYKDGSSVKEERIFTNDVENGISKIYDSSTKELMVKGEFIKGKREGKWKYYDPITKSILTEENYLTGKLEGLQKGYDNNENILYTCNYHEGKQVGERKMYYSGTKNVWYTCSYKDDELDGEVHTYFPSGKLKRFEMREKGKMVSGTCYGESGAKVPFYNFYSKEQCTRPFEYYIKTSMAYPVDAVERQIQGVVKVSFDIDAAGNITNTQIVEGLGAGCDEEALRLVSYMPAWFPRTIDGVAVSCTHIQDIEFKL